MTNFEKLLRETSKENLAEALMEKYNGSCVACPALELCDSIPEEEMHIGCRGVLLRWLEMDVEPDRVVAAEPEVRTVEIGGQLFRMVQTHPFKPEGGGGGIMYPLGNGGSGTVRLYGNDEVVVEAERK